MPTQSSSGRSTLTDTSAAVTEAMGEALRGLGGSRPSLGFVFGAPKHPVAAMLAAARRASPGTEVLACQTAGEVTERGLTHGGVAVLLIASEALAHAVVAGDGLKENPAALAKQLSASFAAASKAATARGLFASTTVVLTDGLAGTGEQLVQGLVNETRSFQQIVGGAAGDEGAFRSTEVGALEGGGPDFAAVAHVFGDHPWGVGVDHGLQPQTQKMRVTRASGNVVHEIEGKPAFDVYRTYARERGQELTPENAGAFLIGNEIGVYFLDRIQRARAPLAVGANGELTLAASIPEGAMICILDGNPDSMVAASERAAREAHRALQGRPAAGVLLFDCICRGMILGAGFQREIDAVRSVFPDVPLAGFLTYGEIARYEGKLQGWHNTTAVVVAIPA